MYETGTVLRIIKSSNKKTVKRNEIVFVENVIEPAVIPKESVFVATIQVVTAKGERKWIITVLPVITGTKCESGSHFLSVSNENKIIDDAFEGYSLGISNILKQRKSIKSQRKKSVGRIKNKASGIIGNAISINNPINSLYKKSNKTNHTSMTAYTETLNNIYHIIPTLCITKNEYAYFDLQNGKNMYPYVISIRYSLLNTLNSIDVRRRCFNNNDKMVNSVYYTEILKTCFDTKEAVITNIVNSMDLTVRTIKGLNSKDLAAIIKLYKSLTVITLNNTRSLIDGKVANDFRKAMYDVNYLLSYIKCIYYTMHLRENVITNKIIEDTIKNLTREALTERYSERSEYYNQLSTEMITNIRANSKFIDYFLTKTDEKEGV